MNTPRLTLIKATWNCNGSEVTITELVFVNGKIAMVKINSGGRTAPLCGAHHYTTNFRIEGKTIEDYLKK